MDANIFGSKIRTHPGWFISIIVKIISMIFDQSYYDKLFKLINSRDNIIYIINEELTEEPEKLLWYVKYYIRNRSKNDLEVVLSELPDGINEDDRPAYNTRFKVLEFFDMVIKEKEQKKNPAPDYNPAAKLPTENNIKEVKKVTANRKGLFQ
jgi:hypothetical protein